MIYSVVVKPHAVIMRTTISNVGFNLASIQILPFKKEPGFWSLFHYKNSDGEIQNGEINATTIHGFIMCACVGHINDRKNGMHPIYLVRQL
jgi:hypothetical protein